MPEKLSPKTGEVNTPETLGATPSYVLQRNAISRSRHDLSATAKKLTAMAMSLLPFDLSSRTAAFTVPEFCQALGISDGGKTHQLLKDAVTECMQSVITIETGKNAKGEASWEKFTWFEHAKFDAETGVVTMTFSAKLATFLLELKKMYAKLYLKDIGKLQSKYGIRILELATSFASMSGKDGNSDETWYCEYSIPDWRLLLAVPEDAYQETHLFKQKVIENPVKEINNAGIGLEITTEGIKQGRKLKAVRLVCKKAARTTAPRRGKNKGTPQPELPKANPKTEGWREEKELHHLKELYPEEFAAFYAEALTKTPAFMADMEFGKITAEAAALMQLKEKYEIVK